jgi:hypothetical protein
LEDSTLVGPVGDVDEVTVSVADLVVALPYSLVKTASKSSPFSAEVAAKEYVGDVAPAMTLQPDPLLDSSHLTVGAGEPDAAALKLAVEPAETVTLDGCSVIRGALRPPKAGANPDGEPVSLPVGVVRVGVGYEVGVGGWPTQLLGPMLCGGPTTKSVSITGAGPHDEAPETIGAAATDKLAQAPASPAMARVLRRVSICPPGSLASRGD